MKRDLDVSRIGSRVNQNLLVTTGKKQDDRDTCILRQGGIGSSEGHDRVRSWAELLSDSQPGSS